MRNREIVLMFKNLLLAILFILPMAANAHSPLSSSSPQNGETLDVSPAEIVMEFKSPAKLIKVELTKSKDKQEKSLLGGLFGGDGESVPLGTGFLMTIDKRQVVPLPSLEAGHYALAWRAIGEDGHVIKGELTFKVKGI
jgi:methionine-rich copper-binding protein CopC